MQAIGLIVSLQVEKNPSDVLVLQGPALLDVG